MRFEELIGVVSSETGYSANIVRKTLRAATAVALVRVKSGDVVTFGPLGNLYAKKRAARAYPNIRGGIGAPPIPVPARKLVALKAPGPSHAYINGGEPHP